MVMWGNGSNAELQLIAIAFRYITISIQSKMCLSSLCQMKLTDVIRHLIDLIDLIFLALIVIVLSYIVFVLLS